MQQALKHGNSNKLHNEDSHYMTMRSEVTQLSLRENALVKEIEDIRGEVECNILTQGTYNFDIIYAEKLLDQERKIKRVYGNNAAKSMRGDFKWQVTDATLLLQKKILKQYEDAQQLLWSTKAEIIAT